MSKKLVPDQADKFKDLGFLYPLQAFSREQATVYLNELEGFEARTGQKWGKGMNFKPHLLFPWVDEICRHPAILDVVEDLIGPNIRVFNVAVWPKSPGDAAHVSWHQDATYFGLEPSTQITVWVALSDASVEAGCMEVVPGSHKLGQMHHGRRPSKDILLSRGQTVEEEFDKSHTEFMALQAGNFSVHDTYLLHASGPNNANYRRVGLGISYIPVTSRSTSSTRLTAMLVRGRDEFGYFDDERQPLEGCGEQEQAFHADAVARFDKGLEEQASKHDR